MLRILQQQAALGEPGGRDLWPRAVAESAACSPFPGVKSWAFRKIIAESATGADSETESAMPLLLLIRPPNVASDQQARLLTQRKAHCIDGCALQQERMPEITSL